MVGKGLKSFLERESLKLLESYFVASPKPMWEMPQSLRDELRSAALVIVKGDLMYRKLVGDCQLPWDTSFKDFISYAPCPLVSLRTLKSPVCIGLAPGKGEKMQQIDKGWLTTGKYGIIQAVVPSSVERVEVNAGGFEVHLT
mmetsp:Transcript_30259/g.53194  ORF Transcript_30259/g.53194 Transcript_30259/m.53194 type:complete len:142 (+) Transcript_30259:93-518(+)|eukprot:CAMPEP_0197517518 /NCGR_PEP_ID=MMETSP1318-20131121/2556_1 /TAXON_ID=552666 /ORGANISM="Partenskyella glossopodia, Strain RCC365" /LENGTH=141 /DNA_ID=CAMNT_0043067153 /DNA_START=95 /DNA_END=520 /DNA_ORIENTATION=+